MALTKNRIVLILVVLFYFQLPEKIRSDIWSLIFGSLGAAARGAGTNAMPVVAEYATTTVGGPESEVTLGGIVLIAGITALFWWITQGMTMQIRGLNSSGGGGGGAKPSSNGGGGGGGGQQPRPSGKPSGGGGRSKYMQYAPYALVAAAIAFVVFTPMGKQLIGNISVDQIVNQARSLMP